MRQLVLFAWALRRSHRRAATFTTSTLPLGQEGPSHQGRRHRRPNPPQPARPRADSTHHHLRRNTHTMRHKMATSAAHWDSPRATSPSSARDHGYADLSQYRIKTHGELSGHIPPRRRRMPYPGRARDSSSHQPTTNRTTQPTWHRQHDDRSYPWPRMATYSGEEGNWEQGVNSSCTRHAPKILQLRRRPKDLWRSEKSACV